jgi:hypothetical protein
MRDDEIDLVLADDQPEDVTETWVDQAGWVNGPGTVVTSRWCH